ncbi:hypothetical protein [Donghicola tyrosinivorans]|uniref:Uncharacterized protein n=1 Tax=Donghicola tyrosinivorans TaxID=1652492 RepID=A0A2T0WRW5_9RHOB|nr:hypothetical protein [Donghicola tyrosinivorans]PRY89436.1 hypothetical protein CLV74_106138 [Donghicola tyrosinivorans]
MRRPYPLQADDPALLSQTTPLPLAIPMDQQSIAPFNLSIHYDTLARIEDPDLGPTARIQSTTDPLGVSGAEIRVGVMSGDTTRFPLPVPDLKCGIADPSDILRSAFMRQAKITSHCTAIIAQGSGVATRLSVHHRTVPQKTFPAGMILSFETAASLVIGTGLDLGFQITCRDLRGYISEAGSKLLASIYAVKPATTSARSTTADAYRSIALETAVDLIARCAGKADLPQTLLSEGLANYLKRLAPLLADEAAELATRIATKGREDDIANPLGTPSPPSDLEAQDIRNLRRFAAALRLLSGCKGGLEGNIEEEKDEHFPVTIEDAFALLDQDVLGQGDEANQRQMSRCFQHLIEAGYLTGRSASQSFAVVFRDTPMNSAQTGAMVLHAQLMSVADNLPRGEGGDLLRDTVTTVRELLLPYILEWDQQTEETMQSLQEVVRRWMVAPLAPLAAELFETLTCTIPDHLVALDGQPSFPSTRLKSVLKADPLLQSGILSQASQSQRSLPVLAEKLMTDVIRQAANIPDGAGGELLAQAIKAALHHPDGAETDLRYALRDRVIGSLKREAAPISKPHQALSNAIPALRQHGYLAALDRNQSSCDLLDTRHLYAKPQANQGRSLRITSPCCADPKRMVPILSAPVYFEFHCPDIPSWKDQGSVDIWLNHTLLNHADLRQNGAGCYYGYLGLSTLRYGPNLLEVRCQTGTAQPHRATQLFYMALDESLVVGRLGLRAKACSQRQNITLTNRSPAPLALAGYTLESSLGLRARFKTGALSALGEMTISISGNISSRKDWMTVEQASAYDNPAGSMLMLRAPDQNIIAQAYTAGAKQAAINLVNSLK